MSLVLAVAAVPTVWIATASWRGTAANEGLIVADRYLNLREVWEDDRFEWTMSVENPTDKDIEIEGFGSSCNCLAIHPKSLTIASGDKADIRLAINLTLGPPNPNEDATGKNIEVSIVPRVRNAALTTAWPLRARVRRVLVLDPISVDLGTGFEGEPFPSKTVLAVATTPLESLVAECPPSFGVVRVADAGKDKRRFPLEIMPKKDLPPGPFQFDITLRAFDAKSHQLPLVKLSVEGQVVGEFQLFPHVLMLGAQPIGQVITETVLLRSRNDLPFETQRFETSSEETTVEPGSPLVEPGKLFRITQKVSKVGNQQRTIRFFLTTPNQKTKTVLLNVTYLGIADE